MTKWTILLLLLLLFFLIWPGSEDLILFGVLFKLPSSSRFANSSPEELWRVVVVHVIIKTSFPFIFYTDMACLHQYPQYWRPTWEDI